MEESVKEEVLTDVELVEEKLESSHDDTPPATRVAKPASVAKLCDELFMLGDDVELSGVKFKVVAVSGLKLELKRSDVK